jgi:hypothetical protein
MHKIDNRVLLLLAEACAFHASSKSDCCIFEPDRPGFKIENDVAFSLVTGERGIGLKLQRFGRVVVTALTVIDPL